MSGTLSQNSAQLQRKSARGSVQRGVRVVLIDDDPDFLFRERDLFGRDSRFEVVGEGDDGASAVRLARTLQPAAVVLDTSMPGMGGWDALALIRRVAPGTAVVVLCGDDTGSHLDDPSVWVGADACVAKSDLFSAPDVVAEAALH
jgi:DNA-binding NarL/FixJ family response regulator